MTETAWEELGRGHYEDLWTPFDTRYHFNPRTYEHETGISEPPGSVTFDLGPLFSGSEAQFAAGQDAVNALALLAMVEVLPIDQPMFVLDWQHPSYRFWPHRKARSPDEPWQVGVFPDGDYYVFLTEDMASGTFGHPWHQTLCVFGDPLVQALVPKLNGWLPVKRHRD